MEAIIAPDATDSDLLESQSTDTARKKNAFHFVIGSAAEKCLLGTEALNKAKVVEGVLSHFVSGQTA